MDRLVLSLMGFSLRYGQTGTYSDGIFIEIWWFTFYHFYTHYAQTPDIYSRTILFPVK